MSKKEQEKVLLRASAIDGDMTEYHFSIEFYIFREGESYIAYCPSLDLSTCAETYNDAISSFYEAFQLYIKCCVESGTLHDDLAEHGWKFQKKNLTPRKFSALMKKPEIKKLMESENSYERVVAPARIPAMA